jgi:hypothetical protein
MSSSFHCIYSAKRSRKNIASEGRETKSAPEKGKSGALLCSVVRMPYRKLLYQTKQYISIYQHSPETSEVKNFRNIKKCLMVYQRSLTQARLLKIWILMRSWYKQ